MTISAIGWKPPVPEEIRATIEVTGLKQHQVAALLGIDKGTVSHWLNGRRDIRFGDWVALEVLAGRYTRRKSA